MTDIERQISEAVDRVARALARAGAPADVEDIAQEGFAVALQALAGFDPTRGALGGYLQAVLRPTLGKTIARWADPYSISDRRARCPGMPERADIDDLVDESFSPEQLLALAESRARAAVAISEALADMGARARELAALDPDATSAEVGKLAGVSDSRVRLARRQARVRIERSDELREIARAVA